jgi:hypothetical protein
VTPVVTRIFAALRYGGMILVSQRRLPFGSRIMTPDQLAKTCPGTAVLSIGRV